MKQLNIKSVIHVLFALMAMLSVSMLIPLGISIFNHDYATYGILYSMIIGLSIGGIGMKTTTIEDDITIRDGFLIVGLGWVLISLLGALPYYLTGSMNSFTDSFFEAMSGFTTTGSTILTDIEILPKSILFWRAFTHWVGGMGIVVLSLAIMPMLGVGGMQMFKAEVPGPTADKITPRLQQTAKLLWLVYVGITFLEVIFLMFGDMSFFEAVCHSFATMATGGFSTRNASVGGFNSAYIDYVITIFMFIAGVNFALHFKLFIGKFKVYWKDFEFKTYLGITLVVSLIIILANYFGGVYPSVTDSIRYGLFQTVSILTTTGFGTADYEAWVPIAQILIFLLMFVGGSAGSTGGGMKVIRVAVVIKHGFLELKKLIHPKAILYLKVGGRTISKDILYSIIGFFILYILMFGVFTIAMTLLGIDLQTSFGCSASCLGNIGPGLGRVGPTDNFAWISDTGKWILSFAMLIGRLEIYTVLVIFTKAFWTK